VKICLVAAPLIARSGVYNSARELVAAARAGGHEWTAVLGVSEAADGSSREQTGIVEFSAEPAGIAGVARLSRKLEAMEAVRQAELIVTLVPQSDMAFSLLRKPWVAYLRGLPWPAPGEANRLKARLWRALESAALRRSKSVWATTPQLRRETGSIVERLVPPGIAIPPVPMQSDNRSTFVWAARYSADKDPLLFVEALRGARLEGAMYGSGPLADQIRAAAPTNVAVPGWASPELMWSGARAYVGTSTREAFGRSAVEAAMLGIPPLVASSFGCAEMLYQDADLANALVIDSRDPRIWREKMELLAEDDSLHQRASQHAKSRAIELSIDAAVRAVHVAAEKVTRSM